MKLGDVIGHRLFYLKILNEKALQMQGLNHLNQILKSIKSLLTIYKIPYAKSLNFVDLKPNDFLLENTIICF